MFVGYRRLQAQASANRTPKRPNPRPFLIPPIKARVIKSVYHRTVHTHLHNRSTWDPSLDIKGPSILLLCHPRLGLPLNTCQRIPLRRPRHLTITHYSAHIYQPLLKSPNHFLRLFPLLFLVTRSIEVTTRFHSRHLVTQFPRFRLLV
jgi:hypothetical protein